MRNFKKVLIVAIAALAFTATAGAQVRFGVKVGMNVNKLHWDNIPATLDNNKNGCGFTGGLMTEIGIPLGGLAVDASFMYTHMSAKSELDIFADNGSMAHSIDMSPAKNFLEIPIHLKYKFGFPVIGQVFSPFIFTGPDFAFNFSGDNNYFKTKSVQYAWDFGIGFEIVTHLQLQAGYSLGINNIVDAANLGIVSDNIKIKNNYWTITAAYLF